MTRERPHARFISLDAGQWQSADGAAWSAAAICVVRKPTERMDAYDFVLQGRERLNRSNAERTAEARSDRKIVTSPRGAASDSHQASRSQARDHQGAPLIGNRPTSSFCATKGRTVCAAWVPLPRHSN